MKTLRAPHLPQHPPPGRPAPVGRSNAARPVAGLPKLGRPALTGPAPARRHAWSRVLSTCLAAGQRLWQRRLQRRDEACEPLRLVTRLHVSHGSTLSVVQCDAERYLVATSAKGQISVLAMAARDTPLAQPTRSPRRAVRP